ncbi:hypothetical protein MtrunA17_Chr3g0096191 [Medicago truncatula]|uniref:VQ domain-containing protein n=1 Tax=Medicago truncatula TaxID=3880 RepID=G7IXH6_MEDTR|nr:hypothetical protein MTR_3g047190 [Medicago truncatula]RHN66848.1 hypothetical protein MtrunA17_Chr3g0096191 [Medicago truncatula]
MGKKVINQASSLKSSKNIIHEKQQFNNLIKVLKPKVYITKSSCFKKLVQELTGNGNTNTLFPQTLEVPKVVESCNIIESETSSVENASFSPEATSYNSSNTSEFSSDALLNEEFNQVCNQLCLDESLFFQDSFLNEPLDDQLSAFQNLESLLFDVETNPPFYSFYEQIEMADVSIYDYELSGLL